MAHGHELFIKYRITSRRVEPGRVETTIGSKLTLLFGAGHNISQGVDGIWCRAVQSDEKDAVLCEAHCGVVGGHYAGEATTRKIWRSGLWWPTTLKDIVRYCKECDLCQRLGQPTEKARMPHQPVLSLEPFQKWGLDFVSPFKPPAMRTKMINSTTRGL